MPRFVRGPRRRSPSQGLDGHIKGGLFFMLRRALLSGGITSENVPEARIGADGNMWRIASRSMEPRAQRRSQERSFRSALLAAIWLAVLVHSGMVSAATILFVYFGASRT